MNYNEIASFIIEKRHLFQQITNWEDEHGISLDEDVLEILIELIDNDLCDDLWDDTLYDLYIIIKEHTAEFEDALQTGFINAACDVIEKYY